MQAVLLDLDFELIDLSMNLNSFKFKTYWALVLLNLLIELNLR